MLLITTSHGIVPTLKRELNYHRHKSFKGFDTGLYVNGWLEEAAYLNLWLRTASKVRLEIWEETRAQNFNALYERVYSHDWKQYFSEWRPIKVNEYNHQSKLNAGRTIQSVSHKAIIDQLTGEKDGNWFVNTSLDPVEVRIMLVMDKLRIYVNTSWLALHQRGYRTEAGEAPLREHIAAAMVLMTKRWYSDPLIDPLCGSGTIPIEAALIATNRAPGLYRTFARESFPSKNTELKEKLVNEATAKIYEKEYDIKWYDSDANVLRTAKENAKRAWVVNIVSFEEKTLFDQEFLETQTLITNPPYWIRISGNEVQKIHTTLAREGFTANASTVISGYDEAENLFRNEAWKHVRVKNGGNDVIIFVKREA
jgi:putative N6-adenine-specific DNA methylase